MRLASQKGTALNPASALVRVDGSRIDTLDIDSTVVGISDISGLATALAAKLASTDAPELIRDTIAAALVAGSGMTITPNDSADTITLSASGGGGGGGGNPQFPAYAAGSYFVPLGAQQNNQSSNTMGIGTLRVMPWALPRQQVVDRMGTHIATAGESGAKFRMGIWADTGDGRPGALILDAGQVAADAAGAVEASFSALTLAPGVYWLGGAVQNVTTTQPAVRTIGTYVPPFPLPAATTTEAGSVYSSFFRTDATGAFASFGSNPFLSAGIGARYFLRSAVV